MQLPRSVLCMVGMTMLFTLQAAAFSVSPRPLFRSHLRMPTCSTPSKLRIPRHSSIAMQDYSDVQQILITKPRTSNAWFGIYFDVQARDDPITIDAIKTGCSSMAEGEKLDVQVWTCLDGSSIGKEEDQSAWKPLYKGTHEMAHITFDRFQTVSEVDNYTELRFDVPISLAPGETRGFLLHTNHVGGCILRGGFGPEGQQNNWKIGDVTDETVDLILRSGLPCSITPFQVESDSIARAFAGSILYKC